MILKAELLPSDGNIEKNKLYHIKESCTVDIKEEHKEDASNDIVRVSFVIKKDQYGYVSNEYIPEIVEDLECHKTDGLCLFIDVKKEKVSSFVFDLKKNISNFDEKDSVSNLRKFVVRRISDFVQQIKDTEINKERLITQYKGFTNEMNFGIATRSFDVERLKLLAKLLSSEILDCSNINPLTSVKVQLLQIGIKQDIELIENFSQKKISIFGNLCDLDVYLLKKVDKTNTYIYELKIC